MIMKMKMVTYYKNGSRIKHKPNRSVTILEKPSPEGPDVILDLRRADVPEAFKGNQPVSHIILHGKVESTIIGLSIEGAMALLIGLQDFFSRVHPASQYVEPVQNQD